MEKIIVDSNRFKDQLGAPVVVYRVGGEDQNHWHLVKTLAGSNFDCGTICPGCSGFEPLSFRAKLFLEIFEGDVTKCGIVVRR